LYGRPTIGYNVGNMDRKGMRRISLSSYNEIDAGDELRRPQKPFLAILRVELNPCGIADSKALSLFSFILLNMYFILIQLLQFSFC